MMFGWVSYDLRRRRGGGRLSVVVEAWISINEWFCGSEPFIRSFVKHASISLLWKFDGRYRCSLSGRMGRWLGTTGQAGCATASSNRDIARPRDSMVSWSE